MKKKHSKRNNVSQHILVQVLEQKGQTLLCRDPKGRKRPLQIHMQGQHKENTPYAWIKEEGGKWVNKSPFAPPLADIESRILAEYDVSRHFPSAIDSCMQEAKHAHDTLSRVDLRNRLFVTMDGADARDFDDAVSIRALKNGWELLVAIADVTHYVRFSGKKKRVSLDGEARKRGNTFYLPTSMVPMLPGELATDLASLKPGTDRRVLVCELHIAQSGLIGDYRFYPAIISSAARLSYEDFEAALLDKDPEAQALFFGMPRGEEIASMLEEGLLLAEALREVRRKKGSLLIASRDPIYEIRKGSIIRLAARKPHAGHGLIEECMLAANEACALFLLEKNIPFPSRIHAEPDPLKIAGLQSLIAQSAPEHLPQGRPLASRDIATILEKAKGTEKEDFLAQACLRALPKARYSPDPQGHFGLAKEAYCHFTSPIRRYADILVHRALKLALGLADDPVVACKRLLHICDHINAQEERAERIDKALHKKLSCLVMARDRGSVHKAYVMDTHERGLFIQLVDIPVSGLIPYSLLTTRPALGQIISVRIHSINTQKDHLTFLPENQV
ncbi:MAG: RNB domain-containing ribonuclease [Desulfovibrionaceae bacterium]|nr:RNB domain-containing ribonuclease [Desulfovibrionaceae bacterium]